MNADLTDDDLDKGPTIRGLQAGLKVFQRYSLERPLGRGGMGVVWLARDEDLDGRLVALKFLPELVQGDEAAIAELKKETLRSLELTHPHIVRIHDWISDGHAAAISMEYVDGETLTGRRLKRPGEVFEPDEIREWVGQLCEALHYAHREKRIVHRDLKPGNLMVDGAGRMRVLDFGIAGTLTDSQSRLSATGRPPSGTLPYMSPQQATGAPDTVSDDIYSLGATVYELLTGKPPFFKGNLQHQIETVAPPSMAERRKELGVENAQPIPEAWERVVAACLAKVPKDRPASAAAMWEALESEATDGAAAKPERAAAGLKGRERAGASPSRIDSDAKRPKVKAEETVRPNAPSQKMPLWPQKRMAVAVGVVTVAMAVVAGVWGVNRTLKAEALDRGAIGDSWVFSLGGGQKLVMKYVPAGTFMMGSPKDEEGHGEDEEQVEVTLSRYFWLGETEVTQGQWEAVMGAVLNRSSFTGEEKLPVESVSWDEAGEFVQRLNGRGGADAAIHSIRSLLAGFRRPTLSQITGRKKMNPLLLGYGTNAGVT